MTKPFPADDIEISVKEAAGHLRDALDHACYSAALAMGVADPKDTGFPFAKNLAGVQGELRGNRIRGNPVEIRPLLEGFQPYQGGNDLLWGLNSIRNPNTHRFILPVGHAAMVGEVNWSGMRLNAESQVGYSLWHPDKNELEYMRVGAGSQVGPHSMSVRYAVNFEGIHALSGKPLIPTLDAIAGEVDRVISAIEAEVARLIATRR